MVAVIEAANAKGESATLESIADAFYLDAPRPMFWRQTAVSAIRNLTERLRRDGIDLIRTTGLGAKAKACYKIERLAGVK